VTTRHGFIPELLDETQAYFVDSESAAMLADTLCHIDKHREEARQKASNARFAVEARFLETRVLGQLRELYRRALHHASGETG
jgi:glycosyltransferase involved in cell wall biosynthesis